MNRMMMMNSYKQFLLRDLADIEPYVRKIGEIQFGEVMKNIGRFIKRLPGDGSWRNFLLNIPDNLKPDVVRCYCYWIATQPFNPNEVVDFNETVTMIRRRCWYTPREEFVLYCRENNIEISKEDMLYYNDTV